jgi:hypothetical protein
MTAHWVASRVRGRALLQRRLGHDVASQLGALNSLDAAIRQLAGTAYGRGFDPEGGLASAEHGIWATLLWHLRILAGWCPPQGASMIRVLAGGFEISNITQHFAVLAGHGPSYYVLGSLDSSWARVRAANSANEVRLTLARSDWGDPGSTDPHIVRLCLELAWARRIAEGIDEARSWAISFATLTLARVLAAGAMDVLSESARHDLHLLFGRRVEHLTTLADLADFSNNEIQLALGPPGGDSELWCLEARFWRRVESESVVLLRKADMGAAYIVAIVGLLAVDAWRAQAALELAANGGGTLAEVLYGAA